MSDYRTYWGLKRSAFQNLQIPEEYFLTEQIRELSQRLKAACEWGESVVSISGPAGIGKTSLIEYLSSTTPIRDYDLVGLHISEGIQSSGWLLPKLALFFAPNHEKSADLISIFFKGLEHLSKQKRKLLVLIDDAHRLESEDSHQELQSLVSMHMQANRMFTFLLFQEPLHPDDARLTFNSKTILKYPAWTSEDFRRFLKERLAIHDLPENVFSEDALFAIFKAAGGVTSKLLSICELCLMESYILQTKIINKAVVEKVVERQYPVDTYADGRSRMLPAVNSNLLDLLNPKKSS
jgi:type II secretory pathway predicted ATPase ExeA